MKRIIFLLLTVFAVSYQNVSAQTASQKNTSTETITVNVADLPEDLAAQLKQKQKLKNAQETAETVNEVAKNVKSSGHEVAVAVDEILGALTKHADAFSKTGAGKFTMGMVFLAIMKDQIPKYVDIVVGYIFGIPFVFFMNICLILIYFRTTRQIRRISGFDDKNRKKYEYVDTWFTSPQCSKDNKSAFIVCFWLFAFLANFFFIWLVIF